MFESGTCMQILKSRFFVVISQCETHRKEYELAKTKLNR